MDSSLSHRKKRLKSFEMCNPLNFKKNIKKENNISKTVLYKIPENNKAFFKNNNNEKDDISLLSNANLNIIKILNTFATDDILNDSSYSISKINEDKDKDKDNIKDKEKKDENIIKAQRNLKNNKSMTGILSDSETIKTETTRGDTLTENSKNRYVYRKSANRKNLSFAIKSFLSGKNQQSNTAYEKKK